MTSKKKSKKLNAIQQTDAFNIKYTKLTKVQLIVKPLAHDVLTKLYPLTKKNIKKQDDSDVYIYEDKVNQRFEGLINIVVGYSRSVEIIEPDSLREEAKMQAKNLLSEI